MAGSIDTSPTLPAVGAVNEGPKSSGLPDKSGFWDAIFSTGDDVDRLVGRAVAALPATGESDVLLHLHDDLRARLERLRSAIGAAAQSERIMLILIFYFDERVMQKLPDTVRRRWSPLQVEWIGSSHGGTEFYRVLDRMLQDEHTPSLVFEVFYFCLNSGFVGRYAGNPDAIEAHKDYLRSRIAVPDSGTPQRRVPGGRTPLPRPRHPAWYYAGTLVSIAALAVVVTALTNC